MKKLYLIFSFVLLVGCSTSQIVTPSITQPALLTRQQPVATKTVLPHPSSTPNLPTATPLPTLQAMEAKSLILDLLKNNGDCLFPCWLGLKPGEADVHSTISFLEQFASISLSASFSDDGGGVYWQTDRERLLLNIIMSFTHDIKISNKVESLRVTIDVTRPSNDGGFETVWENPINNKDLQKYTLPQVLLDHGEPENILLFANEGWRYFELILDYSGRGFAVWYSAPLESSGNVFVGCPSKFFFNLYSWMPELNYTWAEGVTGTGDEYEINSLNRDFIPLEESTSMNVKEFHQYFMSFQNSTCIETPKNIWPGP